MSLNPLLNDNPRHQRAVGAHEVSRRLGCYLGCATAGTELFTTAIETVRVGSGVETLKRRVDQGIVRAVQLTISREFGKSVDWLLTGEEKK